MERHDLRPRGDWPSCAPSSMSPCSPTTGLKPRLGVSNSGGVASGIWTVRLAGKRWRPTRTPDKPFGNFEARRRRVVELWPLPEASLYRRRQVQPDCIRFGQRGSGEAPWSLREAGGASPKRIQCRVWVPRWRRLGLASGHSVRALLTSFVLGRDPRGPPLSHVGHSIAHILRESALDWNPEALLPEALLTVLPGGRGPQAGVCRGPSSPQIIRDEDRIERGKSEC